MADNTQDMQAQRQAVHQLRLGIRRYAQAVQDDTTLDSLVKTDRALGVYSQVLGNMQQISQRMASATDPAEKAQMAQLYAQQYAQADQAMEAIQSGNQEVATMMGGQHEILTRSFANLQATHESLAPQDLGQDVATAGAPSQGEMSIQERIYGYKVEHDANGRPVLPPIDDVEVQSGQEIGIGMGQDIEREQEYSF